ncbi:SMODS domain-containing nucleotidyltransferase [Streptomyces sp. NBC_00582]|uniref:SMODS domain-containing nucleotidyltransferase n=1 Tax=Streptomyces sp. NBC_00582 TaxID=2975783 RepID=UPI002E802C72|nr:hypothetical protein [Streptomyces sp. NBC_00582]WUB60214.1 hypothetical protein OG852_07325 [Streptomyces sp. NBC_00582]
MTGTDLHDFRTFLERHVNIDRARLRRLEETVQRLQAALRRHAGFRETEPLFLPQGSWAQQTIIAPGRRTDFDADLLVSRRPEPSWSARPAEYLYSLQAMVAESLGSRHSVRVKTRCVEVSFEDHHVDLVPYVPRPFTGSLSPGSIVNRAENRFEPVDPDGFTRWFLDRDSAAGGHLRHVTRLLKFARDRESGLEVPSVILTVLLGRQIRRATAAGGGYIDLPTALRTVLTDLAHWLSLRPTLPEIADPSCSKAEFGHRLNAHSYGRLRSWIAECSFLVESASTAQDDTERLRCWRLLFGDGFGE